MEISYGFPVVDAENVFSVLKGLGIKPWEHADRPTSLDEYLKRELSPEQRKELRFAPATEVIFLKQPNGQPFTGFRAKGKNWGTTFVLLPNLENQSDELVPIVGEWKHGAEALTLAPPSGVPTKSDFNTINPYSACAKREFEEESGIELEEVVPLCEEGIPVSGRQMTSRCFPFLGKAKDPIIPQPSKLDRTEYLKLVLIPLSEWLKLIESGKVLEDCAISITFLALRRLQRIKLV